MALAGRQAANRLVVVVVVPDQVAQHLVDRDRPVTLVSARPRQSIGGNTLHLEDVLMG